MNICVHTRIHIFTEDCLPGAPAAAAASSTNERGQGAAEAAKASSHSGP